MAGEITVTETVVSVHPTVSPVVVTVTENPIAVTTTNQGIQGATGAKGDKGSDGAQGPSGVINVNSPITNIGGTTTSANLGLDQTALSIQPNQVVGTAVITTDTRLTDARTPTGSATGDLSGTYPSPTLATLSPSPAGTYGSASAVPRITLDAKGRTTAVTATNIAISGSALDNASVTAAKLANYAIAPTYFYIMPNTGSYTTLVSGNLPANFVYCPYGTTNTPLTNGISLPAVAQTYYVQGYTQFILGTTPSGSMSFGIKGTNLSNYAVDVFWSDFSIAASAVSATRISDTASTGFSTVLNSATTQQAHIIEFKGWIRTNGSAATFYPTISKTTGTTVGAGLRVYGGAYMTLTAIADATTNSLGTWS